VDECEPLPAGHFNRGVALLATIKAPALPPAPVDAQGTPIRNPGALILVKSEHLANPTNARDAVRAKLGDLVGPD